MPRIVFIGCGFLGGAAADLFSSNGWLVLGVSSSAESSSCFADRGWTHEVHDVRQPFQVADAWKEADALVFCASTRGGGPEAYRSVYLEGLLNAIAAVLPRHTVFTSSTSVYGQTDGSLVDEGSVTDPPQETSKILLEAEAVAQSAGGYVLRLGGLYGPGRSVLLSRFLAGEAVIEKGEERWVNQIHREDALAAIAHVLIRHPPPGVYNVTDDAPATQKEVFQWMAESTGRPLPPVGEARTPRRRGGTNKRVSNARIRSTGWIPRYSSYRDALPELLKIWPGFGE